MQTLTFNIVALSSLSLLVVLSGCGSDFGSDSSPASGNSDYGQGASSAGGSSSISDPSPAPPPSGDRGDHTLGAGGSWGSGGSGGAAYEPRPDLEEEAEPVEPIEEEQWAFFQLSPDDSTSMATAQVLKANRFVHRMPLRAHEVINY
jgi:hypothetical protein